MNTIDLELQTQNPTQSITAYVVSQRGNHALHNLSLPADLDTALRLWQRSFLAHHDPSRPHIPTDVVRTHGLKLSRALIQWLKDPCWLPLHQALLAQPGCPLRVRCEDSTGLLERLPWEVIPLERSLWRSGATELEQAQPHLQHRRPHLLLLVGDESTLPLEKDISRLERLRRQGRIKLQVLRGSACSLAGIRVVLGEASGWDGLIFLGHSEADPSSGGRMHLGDGSWVAAHALEGSLRDAARRGLRLAMLNSCSGIDLARTFSAAGIQWVLCFREPVPTEAASQAFRSLIDSLEQGNDLSASLERVRQELEDCGPAGSNLLLSVYATNGAERLSLPLRRRLQFRQRVVTTQTRQLVAAALAIGVGFAIDLVPWNPISTAQLDRRLLLQRYWRELTDQHGPRAQPLAVLLIDEETTYAALNAKPEPEVQSRAALAEVLKRTNADRVPKVALDFVLDNETVDSQGMTNLVSVIRRHTSRQELFAGYYGANAAASKPGRQSHIHQDLADAGLNGYDLSTGTPASADAPVSTAQAAAIKPKPLRLASAIDERHFAHALSRRRNKTIPADAVIDWSVDWSALIRVLPVTELEVFQGPELLVGSNGYRGADNRPVDLFRAPLALQPTLAQWGGGSNEMAGVLVQAALAQSLNLGHWLRPWVGLPETIGAGLASVLGLLIAALTSSRLNQLLGITVVTLLLVPAALQLAVSHQIIVPLSLPLLSLAATTLSRRE